MSDEIIGALNEDVQDETTMNTNTNLDHALMNNRDLPDQHPIDSITDLREKINSLEALQTFYSDKRGTANYYLWQDENEAAENRVGYFVAVGIWDELTHEHYIKVCSEDDEIFGVIIDRAGFVGGQADIARDYRYGLVATTGIAAVRCALDVNEGDCVVPNEYGYAQKAESGYGYKVLGVHNINGTIYAMISLDVPMNRVNEIMEEFHAFDERMDKTEINIVSAMNVANEAHKLASTLGGDVGQLNASTIQKAEEALDKANSALDTSNRLESSVQQSQAIATQAKAIADSAASSAELSRQEAVTVATSALGQVNTLKNQLEPITSWTDAETGATGAEYLVDYMDKGLATTLEVQDVQTQVDYAISSTQKNAQEFQSLVASIDQYSVGEYSQAYGLTREQAVNILRPGMIYIPTKHAKTLSHSETYVSTDEQGTTYEFKQEFTPGYYYTWSDNIGTAPYDPMWIESSAPLVAFFSEEPMPSDVLKYWYVDSNTAPEGYEPYALYMYDGGQWQKVNILDGNVNNRVMSMIRQTANEVAIEISNTRGSVATLSERIDDYGSSIEALTTWTTDVKGNQYNLAYIQQTAEDAGADIALVVAEKDGEKVINQASIVAAINGDGSSVGINADRIVMTGTTTFLKPGDLGENGTTTIHGGRIDADTLYVNAANVNGELSSVTLNVNERFIVDANGDTTINGGSINISDNFIVDTDGNVWLNGNIVWGADNSPTQVVYSRTIPEDGKPADETSWSDFAEESADTWHTKFDADNDYFASYTYDGGATWTEPIKIKGENGSGATVTDEAVFDAITNGGEMFGCFITQDNKLYINASAIKTGKLSAKFIDTTGLKADKIEVLDDDGSVVFLADASQLPVILCGFSANATSLYNGKTSLQDDNDGVYVGTDGIGLGGSFAVTADGKLSATDADIEGKITATSGEIGNLTITDKLFFGGDNQYYINANYNDSDYYLKLPGIQVDEKSGAVFSGNLSAPSGKIGGFDIGDSTLSASDDAGNVYLGTDKIALGDTFEVTSDGKLTATDADIEGKITATEGEIGGCNIVDGVLYVTNANIAEKLTADKINADGIVANNVDISGTINATLGYIGGWEITESGLTTDSVGLIVDSSPIRFYAGASYGTFQGRTINYVSGSPYASHVTFTYNYYPSDDMPGIENFTVTGVTFTTPAFNATLFPSIECNYDTGLVKVTVDVPKSDVISGKDFSLRCNVQYTSYNTKILEDGTLYSKAADIEGKIKATSGDIGGWNVDENVIFKDSMYLYSSNSIVDRSLVRDDETSPIRLSIGNGASLEYTHIGYIPSEQFSISYDTGYTQVANVSAVVTDCQDEQAELYVVDNGVSVVGGVISVNLAVGNTDSQWPAAGYQVLITYDTITSPFRVLEDGSLYARAAEIEGVIKATDGSIGGWQINSNALYYYYDADGTFSGMSPNGEYSQYAFFAGADDGYGHGAVFSVDIKGALYTTNAHIVEGEIGGWILSANGTMRSSQSVYGVFKGVADDAYATNFDGLVYQEYEGYMFTVLTNTGIIYEIKYNDDYTSATKGTLRVITSMIRRNSGGDSQPLSLR